MKPKKNDVIAVWFSCGAASAVAAKRTLEKYPECHVRVINTPIAEEDEDNRRFLADVQKWLGVTIETAINPKWPNGSVEELWEGRGYMSGPGGAICTAELKKKARQIWERENHHDWLVLGFTAEEKPRHDLFALGERENILPVLIEDGITKAVCFQIIQNAGIELPHIYSLGYPNANCIGCVKASSPTYWNHVRKMHPEVFQRRAEQSRRLGARLVRYKGQRVFLDELPASAKGQSMKNMQTECGIFCQEKI
jgi:hypothetical protein